MDNQQLTKEQLAKILDIRRDFYRYCNNNLYIKDKHAKIVKFVPNVAQRALIDYVLWCIQHNTPIRVIILKARQMGLSTAVEALIYWWTATNKNITSVIIGHEEKSAKNLYMMFRRYYDNSNPLFKPSIKYNTRTDLSFERQDDYGNQIGLNSIIKTATAANKSAGRSDTIQCLHASEVGEWENGEELVASIMQTVPDLPNTMIFLESTAKGRGNYFHKEWRSAEKGENNFVPFFFPWWLMTEYARHDDEPLGELTEYEQFLYDLIKKGYHTPYADFDVPEDEIAGKIKFYRRKSKDFASTPERMFQEYPSTANEAFIASGRAVFNALALDKLEKDAPDPSEIPHFKVETGDSHDDYHITPVPYDTKIKENNGELKLFKEPEAGHEYAIGADVAEGLAHGDYSVAEVVDTVTMETVARWRGHEDPDRFGEILGALGAYYNYALIGVEVNNHGLTTIQKLRDTFYTNLFKREKGYDEDFEEPTSNLGWKTDMRTKRMAIDSLIQIIREGLNKDKDKTFIEEAFAYVRDDRGRMNAEEGEHDDTVMAKAIAFQLFPWGDNDITDLRVHKPKAAMRNKKKHKVVK
jgi:hypothetical protein